MVSNDKQILIQVDKLGVRYQDKWILKDIDLLMHKDEIVCIIGPNGAGKTTLVRVILGLLKPTSGRVTRKRALRIGYMPQRIHIEPTLPLTVARFLGRIDKNTLDEALLQVGARHVGQRMMSDLSGGEMQRVLLARALLHKPDLLVLDEPIQGVDLRGQSALYKRLLQIKRTLRCGIVLISHDLHFVIGAADKVICLNTHVCCSGHPHDVSHDPAFMQLFGHLDLTGLAVYSHDHDHSHDLAGHVQEQPFDDQ